MKKWIVRWEVEGFVEREEFNSKREAQSYYDKIKKDFAEYLLNIELYK